ncbi:hypothetical protein DFJ73DRAFT_150357 [Zopfochytrium polystomum]|nr:hypothetical protein DFJ73DRAFT_150357 [Zopfochytrium polystomum]
MLCFFLSFLPLSPFSLSVSLPLYLHTHSHTHTHTHTHTHKYARHTSKHPHAAARRRVPLTWHRSVAHDNPHPVAQHVPALAAAQQNEPYPRRPQRRRLGRRRRGVFQAQPRRRHGAHVHRRRQDHSKLGRAVRERPRDQRRWVH